MTIDIKIGKLRIKSFDEILKEKLDDQYTFTHKDNLNMIDFLDVVQCPDEEDGCTKEDTIFPNSAYRSGSISGICDFFNTVMKELIDEMRPDRTNDTQITKIKPFLKAINKLEYNGEEEQHKKRLHWFKFWCNYAVKWYDEEAVIKFS